MRVVFMGTPALAATVLERLAPEHEVAGVFTRPDAVRGRGSKLVASPVKAAAEALGLPVFTPRTFRDAEPVELLASLAPEVVCVSAYGMILPKSVLDIPARGCLNVHTSLLPRWRGAAPIERAILAGDERTGVCIMDMEETLDTGAWCKCVEVPVAGRYADELTSALADAGAIALLEALADVEAGAVEWTPQPAEGVTYAEKIAKGELALDPADTAARCVAKVRASSAPHPARVHVAERTMAVERAALVEDGQGREIAEGLRPGEAVFACKRLVLRASEGAFELSRVRPDGKKSMDARAFAGGIQGVKGMRLTWGRA